MSKPIGWASPEERQAWIEANAEYWTVIHYWGPHEGYERCEVNTKEQALKHARERADEDDAVFMIYAVGPGEQSTWVANVYPSSW